jgi:putative tryptophan/tyrosine transport system substrate-binding protein
MNSKTACLLVVFTLASVHLAEAQQPTKVPRIVYLSSTSLSAEASRLDGLRRALSQLGYLDGKNIAIDYRFVEGKFARLPEFAAELVRTRVDVIVTTGSPATYAAQQATRTIPIVMTVVGDPVPRFVASLAKPGGNITGLTQMAPELSGKRIELLKEAFSNISRFGIFR